MQLGSQQLQPVQHADVQVPASPAGAEQAEKKQTAGANLQGEQRAAGYLSNRPHVGIKR